MDTKGRLIAGSHNRNELFLINADETARVSSAFLHWLWTAVIVSEGFGMGKSW